MMVRMFLLIGCLFFCCGFSMPISRTVDYSDSSGKSWQEVGTMPVSFVAAQQAWELALKRGGWYQVKTVSIDVASHKHLEIWKKNTATLMLCLWSLSSGTSGYMWGTIEPADQ